MPDQLPNDLSTLTAKDALLNTASVLQKMAEQADENGSVDPFTHGLGVWVLLLSAVPLKFQSEQEMREFTNGFMSMCKMSGRKTAPHLASMLTELGTVIQRFAERGRFLTEDEAQQLINDNPDVRDLYDRAGVDLSKLY